MTQHCHWCNTIFSSISENRGVRNIPPVLTTERVINWGILSCHGTMYSSELNASILILICLRFFNQQVGLMFAFMCYGKQQKNPSLPGGESALKGVCCRISSSLKSQTHSEAVQLLWGWAQFSKAHKYKPALAAVFQSEKRKIQQLLYFRFHCLLSGKTAWIEENGTSLWSGPRPSPWRKEHFWDSNSREHSRKMAG